MEYPLDVLREKQPGTSHPFPIVANLRPNERTGRVSRHYVHPAQNTTICGLSLIRGHAWAPSDQDHTTCRVCFLISVKWFEDEKYPEYYQGSWLGTSGEEQHA